MRRGTNIQIIQVIPTVQIVTNQDTGSADVGQKGVEPKEKDHVKERDRRKRRMTEEYGENEEGEGPCT